MATFSVTTTDHLAIVAGASGLTLLRIDASSSGVVTDLELYVYPSPVITGGSAAPVAPLTDGGPAPLSAGYQGTFSISGTGQQIIDRWRFAATDRDSLTLPAPLTVLPGNAIALAATSGSPALRITAFIQE